MTKRDKLINLKKKMLSVDLPLKRGATKLVFGEGSAEADLFFIGEGPGFWEDQKGRPFVGRAGALLTKCLDEIGVSRSQVFITNVIHYRPPANRDPLETEINAFQPFLDEMIEIIKPKVIITLGRFSMAKFLSDAKISQVHGSKHVVNFNKQEVVVIPMYHPAAALRNGQVMREFLKDFNNIPKILKN